MIKPEKNTERLVHTITRTLITTTLIALILTVVRVIPNHGMSKPALFVVTWAMVFCIVFGGHWLEVLFINYIKFILPLNIALLYFARVIYWYLSAVPLFFLANWAGSSLAKHGIYLGSWQIFGVLYIGIELFMHLIMQLRWKKSFYNGVY